MAGVSKTNGCVDISPQRLLVRRCHEVLLASSTSRRGSVVPGSWLRRLSLRLKEVQRSRTHALFTRILIFRDYLGENGGELAKARAAVHNGVAEHCALVECAKGN